MKLNMTYVGKPWKYYNDKNIRRSACLYVGYDTEEEQQIGEDIAHELLERGWDYDGYGDTDCDFYDFYLDDPEDFKDIMYDFKEIKSKYKIPRRKRTR